MEPLLNILTRTSNRSEYFARNRKKILSQTYKNINHIVCYDDEKDLEYVKKEGYDELIFFNDELKHELKQKYGSKKPDSGETPLFPNLYINWMLKNVKGGWIMVLDDDDILYNNSSLEKIMKIIDNIDIVLWKMVWENGRVIPSAKNFLKIPVLNDIGSPCFMFHSKFKSHFIWDAWSGSDYRALMKLWNYVPRKKYIDEILIKIK